MATSSQRQQNHGLAFLGTVAGVGVAAGVLVLLASRYRGKDRRRDRNTGSLDEGKRAQSNPRSASGEAGCDLHEQCSSQSAGWPWHGLLGGSSKRSTSVRAKEDASAMQAVYDFVFWRQSSWLSSLCSRRTSLASSQLGASEDGAQATPVDQENSHFGGRLRSCASQTDTLTPSSTSSREQPLSEDKGVSSGGCRQEGEAASSCMPVLDRPELATVAESPRSVSPSSLQLAPSSSLEQQMHTPFRNAAAPAEEGPRHSGAVLARAESGWGAAAHDLPQTYGSAPAALGSSDLDEAGQSSHPSASLRAGEGRQVSLADGRLGLVDEAGQLQRLRSVPPDWSPWALPPSAVKFILAHGAPVTLGNGGFSKVFLATLHGLTPVAVKKLTGVREEAVREAALLKGLQHPHIVQHLGACVQDSQLLIVMEYMDGGSLAAAIQKGSISWPRRGGLIAMDVAKGLHYMHTLGLVHVDVKSSNILLNRFGAAKLADVGLAQFLACQAQAGAPDGLNLPSHGTFMYAAPEVLQGQQCTPKSDMWSFGVVIWSIAKGEIPVRGRMQDVRVPEECPQEIADLIHRCLLPDPAQRPTAAQAHHVIKASRTLQHSLSVAPSDASTAQLRAEFRTLARKLNAARQPSGAQAAAAQLRRAASQPSA